MAHQAAPTTTANNANQNLAQAFAPTFGVPGPIPMWQVVQAAPLPVSVNRPQILGYPIG